MFVYWIRYETHTNPYTQGYIGVSKNPKRRLKEHAGKVQNPRLSNAIKKGASMVVLKKCDSEQEALELEKHYRPNDNLGWNLTEGGGMPPKMKGRNFKESKQSLKGEQRTEKQKKASREHAKRFKGRAITPKGGSLSESHKEALRKPKSKFTTPSDWESQCPHCKKIGKGNSMKRWHFDNCKASNG